MSLRAKYLIPLAALILAMLACNAPQGSAPAPAAATPDLVATLTALAPAGAAATNTPPATATVEPTETTSVPSAPSTPPAGSGVPVVKITPISPAPSNPSNPSTPPAGSGSGGVPAGAVRLNFAANATDAVRSGNLAGGAMKEYVLRALKGQIMIVSVASPDDSVVLSVYAPATGDVYLSKTARQSLWQDYLPATMDYVVRVTATGGNTSYTLQVTIPEVIQFAPGAVSARRSSPIAARQVHFYSLRALKGQTMTVKITSPDTDVLLTVYGFTDGQPYKRYQVGEPNTTLDLPLTQDYIIEAVSVRDSATNYTLDVRVE